GRTGRRAVKPIGWRSTGFPAPNAAKLRIDANAGGGTEGIVRLGAHSFEECTDWSPGAKLKVGCVGCVAWLKAARAAASQALRKNRSCPGAFFFILFALSLS